MSADDYVLSEGDNKNEEKQRYFIRMKRRSVSLDDINVMALNLPSANNSSKRLDKLPILDTTSHQSSSKFKGLKKKLSVRLSQSKSSGELLSRNDIGSDASKLSLPSSSKLDGSRSLPEDLKQAIRERRRRSKEKSASADYSSSRQSNEIFDKSNFFHHGGGSLDSYDHQLSSESSIVIKLDDINNSPYETDEPDGVAIADQQLEKLWKKIEKTKEDLTHQQTMKDENVSEYLKTNNNPSETGINLKMKLNFERNNQKTNMNIQLLQKKLEKYQQQVKEIEENGVPGTKRIMKVVQNSVRSGTSSIADAVSKPLESFNNFIKKEKKSSSIENLDCNLTDDDETDIKGFYSYQHTTSDEDVFVTHKGLIKNVCGIDREDMCLLKTSLEKIEQENKESKESIDLFKEALSRVLSSLQEERYKTEQLQGRLNDLFNQWNDLTELHQNEMLGMKEEMDRTLENIECVEYRFTERTADLQEEVENCITRISKMEKQQQDQQPIETILDMDAKILLSKFLSFIINICVVVLFIISSLSKLVLPFVSSRTRLIVSIIVLALYIISKNYSYHNLFCYYKDLFQTRNSSI